MKKTLITIWTLLFTVLLFATEGDTTVVRSHDQQHMKFPPGNRNYTNRVKFPDGSKTYRKILLAYELGCPSNGCSTWDYDTHVSIIRPTGTFDSTMGQQAFFEVSNTSPDSFYISISPTYQTFFDTASKVTDSLMSDTVFIDEYRNASSPTTITNSFTAFETGYYKYYYDSIGAVIDSVFENGDSLWHQGYHTWYTVFEIKNTIEVARLITPYGEPGGVNYYPYTYVFDVTDYAPILKDSMDVLLRFAGWQDGFLATLDFIFVEGTPPRTPKRVLHMYNGSFAYGNANNPINGRLKPIGVKLNSDESFAQLNYTVTGHGADNIGCSEFCAKSYHVSWNGSLKLSKLVWKDDCGYNPIYPQGGTWIYNRANWCPGLPGYMDRYELPWASKLVTDSLKVDFDNHTASGGNPSYSISGDVVTFGPANFTLDAAIEEILAPNNNWLHSRYNPICNKPRIVIKNTGSTNLTSLKISYGPKGGNKSVFSWTGNLKFLDTTTVVLDRPDWARTDDIFEVEISEPNGGTDEYASNDFLNTAFDVPDVMPNDFRIFYMTNNRSSAENVLYIQDEDENLVYTKFNVSNSTLYQDTMNLENGCYTLTLTDAGNDGLEFWNSSQTNGSLRFHRIENMAAYKVFETDFGSRVDYQFMVGSPLTVNEAKMDFKLNVYPNPSEGLIYVEGITSDKSPAIALFDQMGRSLQITVTNRGNGLWSVQAPSYAKGIYTLRVLAESQSKTVKVMLE